MLTLSFRHGELSIGLDGKKASWELNPRASTVHLCDFYGSSCSYVSHRYVFVYALFISPSTSSLVSCFCHSFYSFSWHFSQGFISHFLFRLLKFLSPASWGIVCSQKMIRILTDRGGDRAPGCSSPPALFSDWGQVSVPLFLRGQLSWGCWHCGVRFSVSELKDLCSGCLRTLSQVKHGGLVFCYPSKTPGLDPHAHKLFIHTGHLAEIILHLVIWKQAQEAREGKNPAEWEITKNKTVSCRISSEIRLPSHNARSSWYLGDYKLQTEADDSGWINDYVVF